MIELLEQAIAIVKKLPESEQERIAQIILTEVTTKQNDVISLSTFSVENQPFVGMWQERPEMSNSSDWVRQLRQNQWQG